MLGVPDALRAAPLARARLPEVRHRAAGPVQGRVRLRRRTARRGAGWPGRQRPHRAEAARATRTDFVPVPEPIAPAVPRRTRRGRRRRDACWTCMVDRLTGQGPPAHQVWLPPLDEPPALDELLGPVIVDPARGLDLGQSRSCTAPCRCRSRGGQAVRAAPRPVVARPGRGGRARRGGRRPAERQSSTAAHADLRAGAHPHPGRGAVLLPRLRWRLAGRAARPAARRRGGRPARRRRRYAGPSARSPRCSPSGSGGSPSWGSTRWPPTGGGGPRAGDGLAGDDPFGDVFLVVDGWTTLRGEYEELEPLITDLATRGLSSACTWSPRRRAGWSSGRRCGTCSAPGSSCGSATRPSRWCPARPRRTCRRSARPRHHRRRACTS